MKAKCDQCKGRLYAEKNPEKFLSRLWKWHTTWCPGWKAYQKELAELKQKSGAESSGG